MELHSILGIISILVFYLLILVIGLCAARKKTKSDSAQHAMVADRNIGLLIGSFTMTATWVGGGFINGTAEQVSNPSYGLIWTQAFVGYALSLIVGGLFYARKMREAGYVTMLDAFNKRLGYKMTGILFIPAWLGDIFWSAAILNALGASIDVILQIGREASIIVSAAIAMFYTFLGGLYSVAYTDIIQLICIFIGLWISIPFATMHDAVDRSQIWQYHTSSMDLESANVTIQTEPPKWLGLDNFPVSHIGLYADGMILLICGGIPWQAYFQRVLSSKSATRAQCLSIVAGFGCMIMALPAIYIGAVASVTNWTATDYPHASKHGSIPSEYRGATLPIVLQFLCPTAVSFVGLGSISAAVMSSADSSVLAASSMFAHNVYGNIFRHAATDYEILQVIRVAIVMTSIIACVVAILMKSVYALWYLCSDLIFTIIFPHLTCVLYSKHINTYGSITSIIVGLFFRLSGGEAMINLPPLIKYLGYHENVDKITGDVTGVQLLPYKTIAMLLSTGTLIFVSYATNWLFQEGILPQKWDFLKCATLKNRKKQEEFHHIWEMNSFEGKRNHTVANGGEYLKS